MENKKTLMLEVYWHGSQGSEKADTTIYLPPTIALFNELKNKEEWQELKGKISNKEIINIALRLRDQEDYIYVDAAILNSYGTPKD